MEINQKLLEQQKKMSPSMTERLNKYTFEVEGGVTVIILQTGTSSQAW